MRIVRPFAVAAALATFTWIPPDEASAGGGGCHSGSFTEGMGTTVEIVDGCFTPTVLRVEPGTTVTFSNPHLVAHDVVGVTAVWGPGSELPPGTSVTRRFDRSGTYPYSCTLHPGMNGVVVVGDGTGLGRSVSVRAPTPLSGEPASSSRSAAPVATSTAAVLFGAAALGATAGYVGGRRRRPIPPPSGSRR